METDVETVDEVDTDDDEFDKKDVTERPEKWTGEKATVVRGPLKASVMVTVLTVLVGGKVEMTWGWSA